MLFQSPSHYFLCAGCGDGYSSLNAFDEALWTAGVGDVNLVRLSSILPPGCEEVEPFELPDGALVPTAYSEVRSSTSGRVISAAVAIALPQDPAAPGLIMEHHGAAPLTAVSSEIHEMAIRGMRMRDRAVADIVTTGVEHTVMRHGAVFAGVVMWNEAPEQG